MKEDIEAFIDAVASDDFRTAETLFQGLINAKVADTLDATRVEVAADVYGVPEVDDEHEDPDNTRESDE